MAETEFDLAYEGEALADGRMPVRDLAPALLALGEIFAEASPLLAPGRPPAALEIKATREGSFIVHLLLGGWDSVTDIFSSEDATALVNLKEAIVGVGGVFAIGKWLHGKSTQRTEQGPEPGEITLIVDDETKLTVRTEAWDLYQNIDVRKRTRQVVEPLSRPGVDALSFEVEKQVTVRVDKSEAEAFELPVGPPEPLGEQELELVLSIVAVAFKGDNKWRFTDGQQTFYALIRDEAFLQRVDQGEPFRSGDMLRCRLRITQARDVEGLHAEYEVIEVLEHIPRQTQLQIDMTGDSPSEDGSD